MTSKTQTFKAVDTKRSPEFAMIGLLLQYLISTKTLTKELTVTEEQLAEAVDGENFLEVTVSVTDDGVRLVTARVPE